MSKENMKEDSHYHINVNGEATECVATIRSCPRGGEAVYLRAIGIEGPARPTVREANLYGVRQQFYEVNRGNTPVSDTRVGGDDDTVKKVDIRKIDIINLKEEDVDEVLSAIRQSENSLDLGVAADRIMSPSNYIDYDRYEYDYNYDSDIDGALLAEIYRNPYTSPGTKDDIEPVACGYLSKDEVIDIARETYNPETIEQLVDSGSKDHKIALLDNPNISLDTYEALVEDDSVEVRTALAGSLKVRDNLDKQDADFRTFRDDGEVRWSVEDQFYMVQEGSFSQRWGEMNSKLANDESVEVRRALAGNPNAPSAVLAGLPGDGPAEFSATPFALAGDSDPTVIKNIVENENMNFRIDAARSKVATPELLMALTDDDDEDGYITRYVASNPNTPREGLVKLTKHFDEYTRDIANKRLNS